MPNELITYHIPFKDKNDVDITMTIRDLRNYDAGDPTTAVLTNYTLVGGDVPCVIETFNVNGTPYGIFGKRATVSFKATQQFGMDTFSEGEDGRFELLVYHNGLNKYLFKGYIVMDDNEEQYVPPGKDVFIVATDGLGLLRGVEWTDFDGERIDPDIPVTRIKALAYALAPTGLGLDIIVVDNLYEGQMLYRAVGGGDELNNPWDQSWFLPITHEKEIDVKEDCYTVIQKLLGNNLRLNYSATKEAWIVTRINELKLPTRNYTRFNPGGVATLGVMDDVDHIIEIGHADDHDVYFIARQTKVRNRRPAKKGQIDYKFDIPAEIPRNKDFIRGDRLTPLLDDGIVEYEIDDWRYVGYPLRPDLNTAATGTARIWRVFEGQLEKERYALLANTPVPNFLICKPILVTADDKFTFSVDWRWNINKTGGGSITRPIYHVVLMAFDGTNWFMDNDGVWYQSNATWSTNVKEIDENWFLNQVDETEYRTTSVESKKIPRNGKLMFCLNNDGNIAATNDVYVIFQNIRFEYIPFRVGSYKKYKGDRVTDTQTGRYSNPQEEQVYFSASRKYLDKGVLLNYNSGTGVITLLSDRWFDWAMYHAGAPYDAIYPELEKRLTKVALDNWNHYRNTQREFNLSMRGIAEDGMYCDLENAYEITVDSRHNNFKRFVLCSMKQNIKTCAWGGVLVAIDDSRDKFAAVGSFTSEAKFIE